jgi:hypothetical protein
MSVIQQSRFAVSLRRRARLAHPVRPEPEATRTFVVDDVRLKQVRGDRALQLVQYACTVLFVLCVGGIAALAVL